MPLPSPTLYGVAVEAIDSVRDFIRVPIKPQKTRQGTPEFVTSDGSNALCRSLETVLTTEQSLKKWRNPRFLAFHEIVEFIGLQASGKSSFFKERFFSTHVRISLDLFRTRNREGRLLADCFETQQPFVIDNTNPTCEERAKYTDAATMAKYLVVGYDFRVSGVDVRRHRHLLGELLIHPQLAFCLHRRALSAR